MHFQRSSYRVVCERASCNFHPLSQQYGSTRVNGGADPDTDRRGGGGVGTIIDDITLGGKIIRVFRHTLKIYT
jgi:hypothetical protein